MSIRLNSLYHKPLSKISILWYYARIMIPQFPEFKSLELSDKKDVESFTKRFPPYSDFDFASMWSWDIKGEVKISKLNNNLVVRFTDYLTSEPFYSFLGDNEVNDTAEKLLTLSKVQGLALKLKLIPEEATKQLDSNIFFVTEDRDHFDYIYDTDKLLKMEDSKFHVRRKHLRFFQKNFSHKVKKHEVIDAAIKGQILDLFSSWVNDKGGDVSTDYFQREFLALSRFLNSSESIDFFIVGIHFEEKLIAVSISENVSSSYNVSHFQKAINSEFKGINVYLIRELASLLMEKGIRYVNWEQDLGIAGLRENKESYLPCAFLKKYSISLK